MVGSVSALHAYSSVRAIRREVDVIIILNLLTTIMSINSNGVSNVLFLISVKSSPVFASYRCLLFTNILIY